MKIAMIVLLVSALAPTIPCEGATTRKPRPLWTADLREEGYAADQFVARGAHTANRQIVFGSMAELVVANDANTSFARPGPATGFVLDTTSGQIVSKATWRAKSFPYIFATDVGHYAVNTENGLALYAAGLRMVKVTVPYSVKLASPDGTSFAARKSVPGPHGVTYFLNAETLQPNGVEYLDKSVDSICRDRIAYTPFIKSSNTVRVRSPSDVVSTYNTDCSEPRPHFLSMNVLAVSGCDRVDVIDTNQGLRFSHRTDAHDTNFAGASRDGSRFVIAEAFYGRGHHPKLRFERFTVLDVEARTSVLTVEIRKLRGRRTGASGAALAPDGSLLAINSLGVVQLFKVSTRDTDSE